MVVILFTNKIEPLCIVQLNGSHLNDGDVIPIVVTEISGIIGLQQKVSLYQSTPSKEITCDFRFKRTSLEGVDVNALIIGADSISDRACVDDRQREAVVSALMNHFKK